MLIRRNQNTLSSGDWDRYIAAYQAILAGVFDNVPKPRILDFVDEHQKAAHHSISGDSDWFVHTHRDRDDIIEHQGVFFLPWHREFLFRFEQRMRLQDERVVLPYWNAAVDPYPAQLLEIGHVSRGDIRNLSAALSEANVRDPFGELRATGSALNTSDFLDFQLHLERPYHDNVHFLLGGAMRRSVSPRDPVFWMHHAFLDKIWAHWTELHNDAAPPNSSARMPGRDIVRLRVSDVVFPGALGYSYDDGICSVLAASGRTGFTKSGLGKGMVFAMRSPSGVLAKMKLGLQSKNNITFVIKTYDALHFMPLKKSMFMIDNQYRYYDIDNCQVATNTSSTADLQFSFVTNGDKREFSLQSMGNTSVAEVPGGEFDSLLV